MWSTRVLPQIKETCVKTLNSVESVLEKKGRGFEWLGFDFMVDEDLGVWLIEVNVSPDVSHSTDVTASLVPPAFDQMFDLILGGREQQAGKEQRRCAAAELGDATAPEGTPRWELIYKAGNDGEGEAEGGKAAGSSARRRETERLRPRLRLRLRARAGLWLR